MPYVINDKCNKCAACINECPTGSIVEGKDYYVIDTDTCCEQTACLKVCPVDAIKIQPEENPKATAK